MRIDVHQHLWSEPLLEALESRGELPFVRRERGLTVLYLAGERPYVIDRAGEQPERRAELLQRDGVERALLCLSSPLGIECLGREHALALIDAYHEGSLALEGPFGVWGALALDRPDPDDVDRALARGCLGVSLPAGALARIEDLAALGPLLDRLESRSATLFVHPGPGIARPGRGGASLNEPLWWPAMTGYVAGLQAAWLSMRTIGRAEHPRLRVVFAMLAGLAPLQAERLAARGGPPSAACDPLTFYECSSYGPRALAAIESVVGSSQILYGSDRPVLDPAAGGSAVHDWELVGEATGRALGARIQAAAR